MTQRPIMNIDDVADGDWIETSHSDTFAGRHGLVAQKIGGQRIGASVSRVPPGRAAFPFHHHYGSEEHFFIVRGTGILRYGQESHPVRPGDYIVNPPGGPEVAHQLINTGSEELVYLALGSMVVPEVVGYPDSGKHLVSTVRFGQTGLRFIVPEMTEHMQSRDRYWEGESGAQVKKHLGTK
jgi:uncharacterized cupin superfamily protein